MFYRLVVNLNFSDQTDADDVYDKALDALELALIVNPGQDTEERGYLEIQQCFHDEEPTKPCVILKRAVPE